MCMCSNAAAAPVGEMWWRTKGNAVNEKVSRRGVLRSAVSGGIVLSLPVLQWACGKKELSCADEGGLSADDVANRKSLVYVDKTNDLSRACDKCVLYKAAAPNSCGGCTLVKGPINPQGSCSAFSPKPA